MHRQTRDLRLYTTSVDAGIAGASLGASLRELASEAECVCTASNTQATVN